MTRIQGWLPLPIKEVLLVEAVVLTVGTAASAVYVVTVAVATIASKCCFSKF